MNPLSIIPPVDDLLNTSEAVALIDEYGKQSVKAAIQSELVQIRKKIINKSGQTTRAALIEHILKSIRENLTFEFRSRLGYVINATGIILHTGLGRAPLSESAGEHIQHVIKGYSNLELDMESGKRGDRMTHIRDLLCKLAGSEDALVVNNNAAAVFLSLNTLACGKEVLVSRGELVEIGGSFRIPDIMHKSGVIMHEVGTTNKTKLSDYKNGVSEHTGAVMVAHTSNYRITGFTETVALNELCDVAHSHNMPVIHDLGAGVIHDLRAFNLPYEPLVQHSLHAGVDVVTFSGDKVLGGPQSGILVGSRYYLEQIFENPIMRAVRCGKLTLAGLEGTLKLFFKAEFPQNHKSMQLLTDSVEHIVEKAEYIVSRLHTDIRTRYRVKIETCTSQPGSGALPTEELPSRAIVLEHSSPHKVAEHLRKSDPPVIPYIYKGLVFLNLRTVDKTELEPLTNVLNQL
ncbi:MAG: L-seryl-tRNA(Sec) selenium transferase [candidate division KSB1 bacterium]|nr:L-seryl-tRNA(Sec) selenium transferase [candidate division KSB1 bacterium]